MIIRAEIFPSLKKRTFRKGLFFSTLAFFALLAGSLFAPLSFLHQFGLLLPIGTLLCSSLAMRKCNQLKKMEKNPFLLCFSKEALVLTKKNRAYFLLPSALIESIKFVKSSKEYGLALWLNVPWKEYLFLQRDPNMLRKLHKKGEKYGADLFFPFFTQNGGEMIQKVLSSKPSLNNVMHTDDSHNL